MARALARGWGRPVLCSDALPDRADALATETGGEALASNAELAERADLVVLCHKPGQLEAVAAEVAPAGPGGGLDPGGHAAGHREGGLPGPTGLPRAAQHARRGAAGRDRAGPRRRAGRRRRPGRPRPLRRARDARRPRRRARRPGDGAHELRAGLRRARRRGPGRRRACGAACPRPAPPSSSSRRWPAPPSCCAAGTSTRWRCAARSPRPGAPTARGLAALERGGVRAAFSDALDAVLAPTRRRAGVILVLATARDQIASYVSALLFVYTLMIIAYILTLALLRLRRARALRPRGRARCIGFLRDVCEPYLRVFRRFIPADRPAGPQPDRGDPRRCRSWAGSSSSLIRG